MVLAEIITIGDELLIGQVVDTNSAWMGKRLNEIGIKVKQITSVSDDSAHIISALNEAISRADIILITGGLGPTKDDITKKTLAEYFKSEMYFDEDSYKNIERLFSERGKGVSEINRLQAMLPVACRPLKNSRGTAAGMHFEKDGKIIISMPGVPYEMQSMMEDSVLPELKNKFNLLPIIHKTILTHGIGESDLSELISSWEDSLPAKMKLAYLPSPGLVRLRITAMEAGNSNLEKEVESEAEKLKSIAGKYIFGYDEESIENIIGNLLVNKNATISTAESCTGGFIAHRLTTIPGSSRYYTGSVVAYDNRIKEEFLNVDPSAIEKFGAVSKEVAVMMAESVRKKFKTDYSIAATGIAGPDGGSEQKPLGTVWIAISSPDKTITRQLSLGKGRDRVIFETSQYALNLLRTLIVS
jgi:nicotinamide-nucleotide amidase